MLNNFKDMSLGALFGKLHGAMSSFTKDINGFIEKNKSISMGDIKELREHIQKRLENNEEVEDNMKLRELLNLFATDKAVLEVIKEDSEEWIEMLDAIIENLENKKGELTIEEKAELHQIISLATDIKSMLRKESKSFDKNGSTGSSFS
ncbi:MAG: hypothetical protein ACP5RF_03450 [Candidatus Micrarchaeia archaeon]